MTRKRRMLAGCPAFHASSFAELEHNSPIYRDRRVPVDDKESSCGDGSIKDTSESWSPAHTGDSLSSADVLVSQHKTSRKAGGTPTTGNGKKTGGTPKKGDSKTMGGAPKKGDGKPGKTGDTPKTGESKTTSKTNNGKRKRQSSEQVSEVRMMQYFLHMLLFGNRRARARVCVCVARCMLRASRTSPAPALGRRLRRRYTNRSHAQSRRGLSPLHV
jgi:hypothetical protein